MGADREGGAWRRPARAVAYAAGGVVLLAGCATMPDHGDLRGVESTPRQDTQVRVFAVPPREDATPPDIVQGFLEALTSDDPHYETAKLYLTKEAARQWRPEASTTVLADGPATTADPSGGREGGTDYSFTLTGSRVALVDDQLSYAPARGDYARQVHLIKDEKSGQWRIDGLPQGVVMGRSDFQRNYMSVNKYYFASDVVAEAGTQPAAVADPVYVRRRVDPMTQMVGSLLAGPTIWLDQVVRSSFPTGTALQKGVTSLTPDDQNKLTVPLNDKAAGVGLTKCNEMAAQLLFTLGSLTPAVDRIELQAGDRQLCTLHEEGAQAVASRGSVDQPEYLYFLDGEHRLVRMAAGSKETLANPVPGGLGEGGRALRSAAVARDEETAAGVGFDGKGLYVAPLTASQPTLGEPLVASQGKTEADRLTAPSWDTYGDLWVADRDPGNERLLMFQDGEGEPVEVATPALDGRIDSVRVAADGVRIALVVEKDNRQSLLIGRIERDVRSGEQPSVMVRGLRSATPQLSQITTASWAGDSRLVVVGREQDGVQQMSYVQVDGSTPEAAAPDALTGVESIAASEDEHMPLVAYSSEDGIVRMATGAQWQKVVKKGSSPVYPG
ncbi:LpqB family beta-propeller domain-containing protein [Streptomyces sp. NPDC091377]|uniref:LpqB family beta-propeller domain-containing protein n=1 Tax=unclassified Streptomyces TaxID=2593676 RepID=UPI0037F85FC5